MVVAAAEMFLFDCCLHLIKLSCRVVPAFPRMEVTRLGGALITLGELKPWSVPVGMEGACHLNLDLTTAARNNS